MRRNAEGLPEERAKRRRAFEPHCAADAGDGHAARFQHAVCPFQPQSITIFVRCLAERTREGAVKVVGRKASLPRDFGKIGIGAGAGMKKLLPAPHAPEQFCTRGGPARGHQGGALPHFAVEPQKVAGELQKLLVEPKAVGRPRLRDGVHARQNAMVASVQCSEKGQRFAFALNLVPHHRRVHRFHEAILEEDAQSGDGRARIDLHGVRFVQIQHQERIAIHKPLTAAAFPGNRALSHALDGERTGEILHEVRARASAQYGVGAAQRR